MDDYRSRTKVDWTNPGLDENRVGQNVVERKPFGPELIGRKVGLPLHTHMGVGFLLTPPYGEGKPVYTYRRCSKKKLTIVNGNNFLISMIGE